LLNLSLRQARLENDVAEARIQSAYGEVLPSLDFSGGYVRYDEELGSTRDGLRTVTRYQDRYRAGLRLTQPLFRGSMGPALRASRLYKLWSQSTIREAEEAIRYDVTQAYYQAVLSDHLLQVNIAALETAQR